MLAVKNTSAKVKDAKQFVNENELDGSRISQDQFIFSGCGCLAEVQSHQKRSI